MLSRKNMLSNDMRGMNGMVQLFRDFFRDEPFWSNKPLFPHMDPSKELALMNYMEPLADIIEDEDKVTAKIELPGMDKEEIKINATEDGIEIKCEHKAEIKDEQKKKGRYRIERNYSGFYRYFSLPDNVDAGSITAKYENGLLTLEIPKTKKPSKKSKEIKIK